MRQKKLNCWEYMKCERAPGGKMVKEKGVCPAATDSSYEGINCGQNAGRICWAVAGTCCGGEIQGTFAEKRESCTSCDFYNLVQDEEQFSENKKGLLSYLNEDQKKSFLSRVHSKTVKAGERFVKQGEICEEAYIIQRGSCLIIVEKDGNQYPVDHRGRGDVIGLTSVLTGEPQLANIEAESNMELWVIRKSLLTELTEKHPDLYDILTEIVAARFDSKRPVSDRVIGKYIASEIIGRGAFSIVYKGIHSTLNMPVVVKMLRHDMALNEDFLSSFHNEAKIIANMNHENIVKVFDIEDKYKTLFIIMEYLEGISLRDLLIRMGKLPSSRVAKFIIQICKGLQYAHDAGIIHQDIKPGNIAVLPNDKIKILDFGLACPRGAENFMNGSPFYMSPEQVDCLPVDERTDIYSLGLVAFEMLTGRRPFQTPDTWAEMESRKNREIPDPSDLGTDIPEYLCKFVKKACSRDLEKRYQKTSEIIEALEPKTNTSDMQNKRRKVSSLYMVYTQEHSMALNQLMEAFCNQMKNIGVEIKIGDSMDLPI